jgi:hypothetical protein
MVRRPVTIVVLLDPSSGWDRPLKSIHVMVPYQSYARRTGCAALLVAVGIVVCVGYINPGWVVLGFFFAGLANGLLLLFMDFRYLREAKRRTGKAEFYYSPLRCWHRLSLPFVKGIVTASVCGVALLVHFVLVLCGLPGPFAIPPH